MLVSLPPQQTIFEYLVGCWKRLNVVRSTAIKKVKSFEEAEMRSFTYYRLTQGYTPVDTQNALGRLEKIRELLISYTGLTLQEPEMFPQPSGYVFQTLSA